MCCETQLCTALMRDAVTSCATRLCPATTRGTAMRGNMQLLCAALTRGAAMCCQTRLCAAVRCDATAMCCAESYVPIRDVRSSHVLL